jgi:hypothetical protein
MWGCRRGPKSDTAEYKTASFGWTELRIVGEKSEVKSDNNMIGK